MRQIKRKSSIRLFLILSMFLISVSLILFHTVSLEQPAVAEKINSQEVTPKALPPPSTEKQIKWDSDSNLAVEYSNGIGEISREKYSTAKMRFAAIANFSLDATLISRATFLAGWCSFNLSEWSDSAEWFGKYLSGGGILDEYAAYFRAISITRSGNYEEAVAVWKKFFQDNPDSNWNREAKLSQFDAMREVGKCDEALPLLEKLLSATDNDDQRARILFNIGLCRESIGKIEQAKSTYRDIYINRPASGSASKAARRMRELGMDPDQMTIEERYTRAEKLYDRARWEEAAFEYEKLLADKNFSRDSERGRLTAIRYGMCFYRLYRTERAAEIFKNFFAGLSVGSYTSTAYYYYAHCLGRQEKTAEALEAYRVVIEKTPESELAPTAWLNIAQIYGEWDRWDDAILCLQKIRDKYPGSAAELDVSWRLGWIYYRRGDYDKAAAAFESHRAKSEADDRRNDYWQARALEKSGKKDAALGIYQSMISGKPFGYYAVWAYGRLGKSPLVSPPQTDSSSVEAAGAQVKIIPAVSVKDERIDRARELAQMGLLEFAVDEIAGIEQRKDLKQTDYIAIAAMYQFYGDYNRARKIVFNYLPFNTGKYKKEDDAYWRIIYPQAYPSIVKPISAERNVDPNHVWSIMMQESVFKPRVVSPAGAMGLMQIIPQTAKQVAKRLNMADFAESDLFVPATNIRMGINYLADVAEELGTDPARYYLATAAYNGGPVNVKRWARARLEIEVDEWVEEIPFSETRNYVKKVFDNRSVYQMLYGNGEGQGIPVPVGLKIKDIAPGVIK